MRDQSGGLPNKVRITFPCEDTGRPVGHALPAEFHVDVNLSDAGLGPAQGVDATWAVIDTCPAAFAADDVHPTNESILTDLANQIALDFWLWRTVAYDRVVNGIVVPDAEGITDLVEWTHVEGCCATRMSTSPLGVEPMTFNHCDAANAIDMGEILDVLTTTTVAARSGSTYGSGGFKSGKLDASGNFGSVETRVRYAFNYTGGSAPTGRHGVVARRNGVWGYIGLDCAP